MSWLRAIPFLFTLLAFVLQPASASAFGSAHPEARVSAFEIVALASVGASAETSHGLHEGIGAAYDETASGYRFAARGAGRGWRLGDDVYAATARGNAPSWSTVRSRFWKNEAAAEGAAQRYGAENLARMQRGRAPQRFNPRKGGMESMELSHEPIPAREGGRDFVPRWPEDHARVDPFRRPGY